MSQGALSVPNGSGLSVRSGINAALARLASKGSGTGRPADIATYETWVETDNPGSGVVSIWQWDGTADVLLGILDTINNSLIVTASELRGDTVLADGYTVSADSVVTEAGTTVSVVAADNGKVLKFTAATAVAVTIPNTLPDGFSVMLVQYGAGQVTIVAGSGVTLRQRNGLKLSGQYAAAALTWLQADTFLVAGDTTT